MLKDNIYCDVNKCVEFCIIVIIEHETNFLIGIMIIDY